MAAPRLVERARKRLVDLLADDRPSPERWIAKLQNWGALEGQPPFASAVRALFHLEIPEAEAEAVLRKILAHRDAITGSLGRDPGLRVAGVDYLANIDGRLSNPKIVEMDAFERTERSARTDGLTGLLNRRVFKDVIDREIRRGRRYRLPLALVMLDLDDFKRVNDEGGHLLGDLVLERFASVVRKTVREADCACRYGGDEFALVLPETERSGAFAVGERVRTRAESSFRDGQVAGRTVTLTVSGGVACYPEDGTSGADLLARADAALYLAKERGRNRVVAYHAERRESIRYPGRPGVRLALRDTTVGSAMPVRAINVSRFGALLETEIPLEIDAAFDLVLTDGAPGHDALPVPVARGRVVRVESDAAVGLPSRSGVTFLDPLPEDLLHGRLASNVSSAAWGRGARR